MSLVQSQHVSSGATGDTTIVVTLDAPVQRGNTLVAAFVYAPGTPTPVEPSSVALETGEQLALCQAKGVSAYSYDSANDGMHQCWYRRNMQGGGKVVTVTFPSSRTYRSMTVMEFKGSLLVEECDEQYVASGTPDPGIITPLKPNGIIVSFGGFADNPTQATGFTQLYDHDSCYAEYAYLEQGVAAQVTSFWQTITTTSSAVAVLLTPEGRRVRPKRTRYTRVIR